MDGFDFNFESFGNTGSEAISWFADPGWVVNGGSGSPGPLVAIPGVYTGYVRPLLHFPCCFRMADADCRDAQEPGILININVSSFTYFIF